MIKRNLIIPVLLLFSLLPGKAQEKTKETVLKREVTLYNPYKPSLPEAKKRSFLPDMKDTIKVRPNFRYDIKTKPFLPVYTVSPIKAAALLPDPLPKLYKSYINIGLGNYITPLAEISITNERSKKGTVGFYGRHFSSNGKVSLQNDIPVFAGYMDNDASLFGRKFFRKSLLESSVDLTQKTRYAYGYDPAISGYSATKKDIRMGYANLGAKASFSSVKLDSSDFSYDFDGYYNYFYNQKNLFQHNAGFNGTLAKSFKGFYVGSGVEYDFDRLSDSILTTPKYITSLSPFIKKSSEQWSFKLGFQALLDRNMTDRPEFHIYPDIDFSFSIVPSYVSFFAGLSGKLEKNDPLKIINENPYLLTDGTLFKLRNTDHEMIITSGVKGNNGIGGNYLISASFSLIDNMLFFANLETPSKSEMGNYFVPFYGQAELLKGHGEMSGIIGDKISYIGAINLYKYTLTNVSYAWNKPDWDAKLGLKYNLRDKIIIGAELKGTGKRNLLVMKYDLLDSYTPDQIEMPAHINLNLNAEYRYSKILSFWTRFDNISYDRYYEWAYYPSQRFLFMLGFTYSL